MPHLRVPGEHPGGVVPVESSATPPTNPRVPGTTRGDWDCPRESRLRWQRFRGDNVPSCWCSPALQRDLSEVSTIAVERCLPAGVVLVAPHNAVSVFRIDLHDPGLTTTAFTADQGATGASKQVDDSVTYLAAVQQSTLDQF